MFVMLDGVRWQEVFSGAEESLLNKERGGVANVEQMRERFWRESADERREALMPFVWSVVAKQGQLYGNHASGSIARVVNDKHFSYPGYSEILCGFPDPAIDTNDKNLNRNVTFLEWLHAKDEFKGRVAAFTSWDTFAYIINAPRSRILVNAGFAPLTCLELAPEVELLNKLMTELPLAAEEVRHDALTFRAAMSYLKRSSRV